MDVGEVQSGYSRFWTTPQLGIPANITSGQKQITDTTWKTLLGNKLPTECTW